MAFTGITTGMLVIGGFKLEMPSSTANTNKPYGITLRKQELSLDPPPHDDKSNLANNVCP